jgi:hypothetical protein
MDSRMGSRPLGMAEAFTALAEGIYALNYNPAGLALDRSLQGSFEYANLYPGLDDGAIQENFLAYAQHLYQAGGIGLTWNNRNLPGIYDENLLALGYAIPVNFPANFWVGLGAKLFLLNYTDAQSTQGNSFFNEGRRKIQASLDVGLLYSLLAEQEDFPGLRLGAAVCNATQPDLGMRRINQQPAQVNLGLAGFYRQWDADLDLVYAEHGLEFRSGAELWGPAKRWGARAGFLIGQEVGSTVSLGGTYVLDLSPWEVGFCYAFNYSFGGIMETAGIHRISMDFRLPLPSEEEKEKRAAEHVKGDRARQDMERKKSYWIYEKLREIMARWEQRERYAAYRRQIEPLKKMLASVSDLLKSREFGKALVLLNQIKQQNAILDEKYRKETAGLEATRQQRETELQAQAAKRAELVAKVKEHLKRKIQQYAALNAKLNQLRSLGERKIENALVETEKKLLESRDALIAKRNARAFLTALSQAEEMINGLEKKIAEMQMRGQ